MTRELTGRKVFAIIASAFTVVIGVNVLLAFKAVSTFPGLEVANSYVASQSFDTERAAQNALGWTLEHGYAGGRLTLAFRDRTGVPVRVEGLTALVGRTTEAAQDVVPEFAYTGGVFQADVALPPGKWMILLEAQAADGTRFHQRLDLLVKG